MQGLEIGKSYRVWGVRQGLALSRFCAGKSRSHWDAENNGREALERSSRAAHFGGLNVTCATTVKADEAMSCRELFGRQLPLPQALEKDFNAAKQAFNGDLLTLQACKSLSIASA